MGSEAGVWYARGWASSHSPNKPQRAHVLARLFFLFIVVPLVDLTLVVFLGSITHWAFAVGLVLATGALGAWLAKEQGAAALGHIRDDLRQGRMPTAAVVDAFLVAVAGAFLLSPGLLTDLFGMALLYPPTRRRYRTWMLKWLGSRFRLSLHPPGAAGTPPRRSNVVDSYVVEGSREEVSSRPASPHDGRLDGRAS